MLHICCGGGQPEAQIPVPVSSQSLGAAHCQQGERRIGNVNFRMGVVEISPIEYVAERPRHQDALAAGRGDFGVVSAVIVPVEGAVERAGLSESKYQFEGMFR